MKKHIPNFITCLNLFTGCVAIFIAFQGNLTFAAYLVGVAAVFDFLDGLVARVMHAYSEIGKQLDSLADMVSFGVLPGVIMFQLMRQSAIADPDTSLLEVEVFPFSAFIIVVFSALRLAKFNIDTRQTSSFIGLPTPANTLFVSSLPLILAADKYNLGRYFMNQYVLLGLSVVLCYILVAEIPLFALKFKNLSWRENNVRFIFLILSIPLLLILKFAAIPIIILLYVLLSVVYKSKNLT